MDNCTYITTKPRDSERGDAGSFLLVFADKYLGLEKVCSKATKNSFNPCTVVQDGHVFTLTPLSLTEVLKRPAVLLRSEKNS